VHWIREADLFPEGGYGDPDSLRALRPWVLEEDDGTLRMWYSGSDGETTRILEAVQHGDEPWERLGVNLAPGLTGDSDGYGVESPCVVRIPSGYLMTYGGFDGEMTRLHMATSSDGRGWESQGTILQRGAEDLKGANHPCLVMTGERWWLFFTGYTGQGTASRGAILGAVSQTGASWDRVGPVLTPVGAETAASHPCVLDIEREFAMFYSADKGREVSIALATSPDGVSWDRRGAVLHAAGEESGEVAVHTPCVLRLRDGSLRIWFAALTRGDREAAYRIRSARGSADHL
jgi:predicted GH43/DUF377 family glycosyl hydrolase